uniref:Membrane-associated tyrosine- and threonine-specific cdc2-inhibitory kinase wee-1.3 n=1 Tax=Globodera pallida TaxID=36090 RepID=A0A183C5K6_GLOPA
PPARRLMKSAPNMHHRFYLARDHIEPFAQIVSFKQPEDQPTLGSRYRPDLEETYLQQCFVLQGRLGQGDFGEVVNVRSKDDGKLYAVKCALDIYRNTADRREKLQEAWEERGRLYIQTELCSQSLDDLARERHEIPEPEIWYYLIDLLMALEHMHSHDIIHVDIKPSNIFVTSDGICKLGDFGLVFDLNKDDPRNASEGDSKYLATEVLNDKPTKAADIFSLGMTILELATDLDLPNNGVFWHEIRDRMIDEKYIGFLSPDLRRVLAWMIDPSSLNRPKASELLKDPAIKKHKLCRKVLLMKHQMVLTVSDHLSIAYIFVTYVLYYVFLPFIWLFDFAHNWSKPIKTTPYSKRGIRNGSLIGPRDRTPEFNMPSADLSRQPISSTPFRFRLNFDDPSTYSDNENGRSPVNQTSLSLPDYSGNVSPYACYTGSGDSPTSSRTRSGRKRRPRRGDELFVDRRHLRKSREVEEELEEVENDYTISD